MQTDVDALYDGMIASSIMAHAERRADDSTDYFKSAVCVILLIRRRGQGEMVQYKTVICASYRDSL